MPLIKAEVKNGLVADGEVLGCRRPEFGLARPLVDSWSSMELRRTKGSTRSREARTKGAASLPPSS